MPGVFQTATSGILFLCLQVMDSKNYIVETGPGRERDNFKDYSESHNGSESLNYDEYETSNGENETSNGENETSNGELENNEKIKGELKNDEKIKGLDGLINFLTGSILSGNRGSPSGNEKFSYGDGKMTSGDGKMTSGDGKMTSGDGKMTFGDGKMTSGDGKMTSGDEKMTSGDGKMTSGYGKMTYGGLCHNPPVLAAALSPPGLAAALSPPVLSAALPPALGGVSSRRGQPCKMSHQCPSDAVCTNQFKCERIYCQDSSQCTIQSPFPTECQNINPGTTICMQKICQTDKDCRSSDYGCFMEQCKPKHGACSNSCDCVDKYGMIKEEAYCHNSNCYCRSETVDKCFETSYPQDIKLPVDFTGNPAACSNSDAGPFRPKGGNCRVHSSCIPMEQLVCLKPAGSDQGVCNQVSCQSDRDCKIKTDLPIKCYAGMCRDRSCYDSSECPQGYGCYSDNQCKKILGDCRFDCDCGQCPGIQCFKDKCFCMNDHDICSATSAVALSPLPAGDGAYSWKLRKAAASADYNRDSSETSADYNRVSAQTSADYNRDSAETSADYNRDSSSSSCDVKREAIQSSCPTRDGWQAGRLGCYKVLRTPLPYSGAKAVCVEQGGALMEVESLNKHQEISAVLNLLDPSKSYWIGAQRKEDDIYWISNKFRPIEWTPDGYSRASSKKCLAFSGSTWTNMDCSTQLPAACQIYH